MILKSDLAAELSCPYNQFRLELRAIERKNSDFHTGKRKYLTLVEAKTVRDHFATLASPST